MLCQRCNGLLATRYDVELCDWEGYCVNCGAIPFAAKLTTPPKHGLCKENRAKMEDDPFLCACGKGKNPERAKCLACNARQRLEWRKKVKERRERAREALKKELAV